MVFVAIMLAEIWRATAIMLVILVAGIGLIPKEYYEAAEVFGASPWKRFLRITLPLLRPSLSTALVLRVILAFEVFAVVQALGGTLFPVLMGETFNYQFELLEQRCGRGHCADHPGHLDRLHPDHHARSARPERSHDMTTATADIDATASSRKAGPLRLYRRESCCSVRLGHRAALLSADQHAQSPLMRSTPIPNRSSRSSIWAA